VSFKGLECAIFSAYQVVEKIEVCVGEYVVACSFRNVDNVSAWAFVGVYGPNISLYGGGIGWPFCWWDLTWCIGSDFNVTRFPCERLGIARFSLAMIEFSEFISEQGLMNLSLAGGSFMWSNNSSWSRLDKFLVSLDWEAKYPWLFQKRVPRLNFLILL
jgi:hypothetical protein